MIPTLVENWIPRPPMTAAPSLVGTYVRVDPFDKDVDVPLLWDALGGNNGTINERLKWYGIPNLNNENDLLTLLTKIEEPVGCCVNVFRLIDSGDVAGMSCYIGTRPEHGSTEVGYVAHGHAMARSPASTEAQYLLAKHAFDTMGYRRYEWKCDSNNVPSNTAAKRLGFTFEGCFRQHVVTAKGTNRDTNWYSILDKEWIERKHSMEQWLNPTNFDENGLQQRRLQDFQSWMK